MEVRTALRTRCAHLSCFARVEGMGPLCSRHSTQRIFVELTVVTVVVLGLGMILFGLVKVI